MISRIPHQRTIFRLALFFPLLGLLLMGQSAMMVPGQVIIQFAPESEGEMAVITAIQVDPPDLAGLGPVTADLQTKTGIFLQPTHIIEDKRVIFSIDIDLLTNELELRLHKRRNVETLQLKTELDSNKTDASPPTKLLVSFIEDSAETESLHQQSNHNNEEQKTFLADLEKELRLPLAADFTQEGKLLLWIDLEKLTLILVDQLNPLPEIQSAQLNHVVPTQ